MATYILATIQLCIHRAMGQGMLEGGGEVLCGEGVGKMFLDHKQPFITRIIPNQSTAVTIVTK